MGDLDDELKKALEAAEANRPGAARPENEEPPAVLTSAPAEPPRRNIGLLIGLLALVAGILALVFTSVDEAAIYSVATDQLVNDKDEFADRNVRVEGDLKNGTLRYRKEPCEYRFVMQKNGKELAVRYPACVVPDTFKDVPGIDVQVTAEGKLSPEGHFEATHIMAKCPSKYEMQQRAANGEQAPHEMMGEVPTLSADEN